MAGLSAGIIVGGLATIASITMLILLAIWTYKDADSKGMIPLLWTAIVVLVPSFIGLIVYLIVRSDNNKITCSNCNTRVNSNMKFCSNCGMELRAADIDLDKQEAFKKGQRNLLIGIFVALGVNIVCVIMSVVFFIIGAINLTGRVVDWGSENIDINGINYDIKNALAELDESFGDEEFNINVKDNVVVITGDDGEEILRVDGNKDEVNINSKEMRKYIKDHGGDESISDDDIRQLEDAIENAIENGIETDSEEIEEHVEEELDD